MERLWRIAIIRKSSAVTAFGGLLLGQFCLVSYYTDDKVNKRFGRRVRTIRLSKHPPGAIGFDVRVRIVPK